MVYAAKKCGCYNLGKGRDLMAYTVFTGAPKPAPGDIDDFIYGDGGGQPSER